MHKRRLIIAAVVIAAAMLMLGAMRDIRYGARHPHTVDLFSEPPSQ